MMDLHAVRKTVGNLVFNHLIFPPGQDSPRLKDFAGDYGHGFLYEELFSGDGEDLKAALNLIERDPGPVLDLAGGAGRLSEHLARNGITVILVDRSLTMLEKARKRRERMSSEARERFEIYPQDITRLSIDKKFRYVFSLNNGLEHLGSESEIVETVRRVGDHLDPAGSFFLDVHFPMYLEKDHRWKTAEWTYTRDVRIEGVRYRVWSRTLPGKLISQAVCDHAISEDLQSFRLLRTPLFILSLEKWTSLFREAGFRVEGRWGSWKWEKIGPNLPKLVFHLKKL
jgi:SAM-dependent methyltransferase